MTRRTENTVRWPIMVLVASGLIGLGAVGTYVVMRRPVTGAAINPARYFGTLITGSLADLQTHWDQAWVYVVADLGGAAVAAFLYDVLATPRKVARPAVTTSWGLTRIRAVKSGASIRSRNPTRRVVTVGTACRLKNGTGRRCGYLERTIPF